MNTLLRYTICAIFTLSCVSLFGQIAEQNIYKEKLENALANKDAKAAGVFYKMYQTVGGQADQAIEKRIRECGQNSPTTPASIDEPLGNQNKRFTVKGISFDMVAVTGGSFVMGATAEQIGSASNEKPAHTVRVSDFYIGKYEVTQALWYAVMGVNPSSFKGDNRPVENINWFTCQEFIAKLNQLTGVWFRLPTEAEWEYAARGGSVSRGTPYSGSAHVHEVAWFGENSEFKTHQVGLRRPNELGIHDMSGNVCEWCSDWYGADYYKQSTKTNPTGAVTGSDRVIRGGSYFGSARECRSAFRRDTTPGNAFRNVGLRLVFVPLFTKL